MKNFRIEKVPASTLVKISFTGGGEVPDELKSFYTSQKDAAVAIAAWLAANPDREVKLEEEVKEAKPQKPKSQINYDSIK